MIKFATFFVVLTAIAVGILYHQTGLPGWFHTWETEPIMCVAGVLIWACVGGMFTCMVGLIDLIGTGRDEY